MRSTAITLSAIAGVVLGAQVAAAEPVPVLEDRELGTRLFRIAEDFGANPATVTRAMSDDVVGAYCQWQATAEVDRVAGIISNVRVVEHDCKDLAPEDTAQWAGGSVDDARTVFPNMRVSVTPDAAAQTVVESRHTGPNGLEVVSEFRRTWDFSANEVCLYSEEGMDGEAPYIQNDLGCYDIPDNDHAARIRAALAM